MSRLLEVRTAQRWSRQQLASACGTTRQNIRLLEVEGSEPRAGLAVRIAAFLGVTVPELWGGEDSTDCPAATTTPEVL